MQASGPGLEFDILFAIIREPGTVPLTGTAMNAFFIIEYDPSSGAAGYCLA